MRIAHVATLSTPVRETHVGSVEGLVWLLSRELVRIGHDVTVFGASGSETAGRTIATLPGPYGQDGAPDDWQLCEWINLTRAGERSHEFDLIHTHAYLWGIPLEPLSRCPMLHTMHVMPDDDSARLRRMNPASRVSAVSRYQWQRYPDLPPAVVVHHGVDAAQFTFRPDPEDYLCYLGRFIPGKGPVAAIEAARRHGRRLLLAGPRNAYFDEVVAPLVDDSTIVYVGPVSGRARDQLLGGASALVYPVQQPEPFGLVLVEAMMCGTPVASLRVGAVQEIVDEGLTGCTAAALDQLPDAIARATLLDRSRVRQQAVARFSSGGMVSGYEALYREICKRGDVGVGSGGQERRRSS